MPHNLLLADDSVTIQRVIKLTFADEDVDVVAVGDGDQAVAAIDKAPPDIVLADIAMPGRSGYDVALHIRNTPRLAHIPVMLLTGAFEPVDEARASEVGCDGVLAKPFEPEVVVSRVRELLSRPRPTAPVAPPAPAAVAVPKVPPVPAEPARPAAGDIDAYFDRLDQAFANLGSAPRPIPAPELLPAEPSLVVEPPMAAPPSFVKSPEPAVQSLAEAFEGLLAPGSGGAVTAQPEPRHVPAPVTAKHIAAPAAPVDLVGTPSVAQPPTPTITDAQVDVIASRVLDQLTARAAGGNLADVVAQVAERIVRDEIEKIKRRL